MFTGIIERVGILESLEWSGDSGRLRVGLAGALGLAAARELGSSIAVNGCCLTVAEKGADWFAADLSAETRRRTAFGELRVGARLNLETPLAAGKELGGHFVQGHVDGVGRVAGLRSSGADAWLSVRVHEELTRYLALKGSIAVDGISLTIAGCRDGLLEAAIIPFTLANTNLRERAAGDAVNLECDILAKYVERLLEARGERPASRLTLARLEEEGF